MMSTVAYLTNQFPSPVEWYVIDEIEELRRRGAHVICCSSKPVADEVQEFGALRRQTIYLWPPRAAVVLLALWSVVFRLPVIAEFLHSILLEPGVGFLRRLKAVIHTLAGAYYAGLLRGRIVDHIHVHHGYFSSWIAMVAARLLGVPFSMTLHGSDVLLDSSFLGVKLRRCAFCITISEFNRRHILRKHPEVNADKIQVQRLGVDVSTARILSEPTGRLPLLLAVGRLHSVKNHTFLLQACSRLRRCGMRFRCIIVGDGPDRKKLATLIRQLGIEDLVTLAGHVPHSKIGAYYELADLVVLTSHSEGIPLVLMEAMARGKVVLAPAITGIPELVIDGQTGFLFRPGSLEEFVWRVQQILGAFDKLGPVRSAAQAHVRENFERRTNLENFAVRFLQELGRSDPGCHDEDFVLQQI